MIDILNLRKSYGIVEALKGITFSVKKGEIVGFLGPNGAGKTTCMKVITGYISATSGEVKVDGLDIVENSVEIRKKIGYLPENAPLYSEMAVLDYLKFVAKIRKIQSDRIWNRIEEISHICGLSDVLWKEIGELSKGYRQRTGLAQALIHNPEILILDEPTSGLDPNQIVEIRELIKKIGSERTVILSTHNLPEVVATCNRIIIIHKGKIAADGTPDEIQAAMGGDSSVRVVFGTANGFNEQEVMEKLSRISGVKSASLLQKGADSCEFAVEGGGSVDVRPLIYRMSVENSLHLLELYRVGLDLEGIFRKITQE